MVSEAQRQGAEVVPIRSPRLRALPDVGPAETVEAWIVEHRAAYEQMAVALEGTDVIVNAAGMAAPASRAVSNLYGANSALPGLLATAAAEAGVRRLVHVSSAASQGRQDPLDETPVTAPVTPYGDSKARGEAVLLKREVLAPPEIVIYRPTSVQAPDRAITRQLIRLAALPAIPTCASGEMPLPVTLIENVAAGILHVCQLPSPPSIVLQSWEGMTVQSLMACFGHSRILNVPRPMAHFAVGTLLAGGRVVPAAAAIGRRLELIAFGQRQDARALTDTGFTPPVAPAAYRRLAEEVRRGDV